MTPDDIRNKCRADGLALQLRNPDTIVLSGPQDARERWAPIVRENKPQLLELLQADASLKAAGRRLLERLARELHHDLRELLDWYEDDLPYLAKLPEDRVRRIVRDYIDNRSFHRGSSRTA